MNFMIGTARTDVDNKNTLQKHFRMVKYNYFINLMYDSIVVRLFRSGIMNSKLKNDQTDFLFEAILTLKTKEDCYRFFEDLCTQPELNAMSQRIVVAKLLNEKTVYNEIVKQTGASTATISRVKRSLNEDTDGYMLAFKNLGIKVDK